MRLGPNAIVKTPAGANNVIQIESGSRDIVKDPVTLVPALEDAPRLMSLSDTVS